MLEQQTTQPQLSSNAIRVVLALSTIRRGPPLITEYLWSTVDSILPHLGASQGLEVALVIVDVEKSGEFTQEIEQRYKGHPIHVENVHTPSGNPCDLAHLYNDTLERTVWRTQRVIDLLSMLRVAAKQQGDYIFVLEDDTVVNGDLVGAMRECVDMKQQHVMCRWDFWMKRRDAEIRLRLQRPTRIIVPPGNLQGVFGLMMPTEAWMHFVEWAQGHTDKAPADWLIGRWLNRNGYEMAHMRPRMNLHHMATISTRKKREKRSWTSECPEKDLSRYSLHWAGGDNLFIEVPYMDIEGFDEGVHAKARFMDQAGHLMTCDDNPKCVAVNRNGWMKKQLETSVLTKPHGKKALYIKVNGTTDWAKVSTFYDECMRRIPWSLMRRLRK